MVFDKGVICQFLEIVSSKTNNCKRPNQGCKRSLKRISLKFNWAKLRSDLKNYIESCEICQRNKLGHKNKYPMVIMDTPSKSFEKCTQDIAGSLT